MDSLKRLRQFENDLDKQDQESHEVQELQSDIKIIRQVLEKYRMKNINEVIDGIAQRIKKLKGDLPS